MSIFGHEKMLDVYFRKKKSRKKDMYVMLVGIWLICCLAAVPVWAEEADNGTQTVRVGFFGFEGYHQQDENGNRSGYGYDFLQMIAPYAGFEYEYIGYDKSWSDMLRMLMDGEIDMVTSAKKTPEREEIFDFSERSMGTSYTVLTTRPDNTRFTTADYSTLEGIRVGLMKGSVRVQGFDKYAKEHNFSYQPIYYTNAKEILKALAEGNDIDAVLTSDLRILEDETIIDKFDEAKIYAIVKKGNTKLIEKINRAIEQLDIDSPGWDYDLSDKYYKGYSNGNKLILTTEERNYIKDLQVSNRKLKVIINPDLEPYSYFENGQAKGILVDLLETAAKEAGFSYEIIETADVNEYLEVIRSGRADLVFDATFNSNTAEEMGYYLTSPYYTATYACMTSKNNNAKDAAAIRMSDGLLGDRFLTQYVDETTIQCNTFDECVKAIRNGSANRTYAFTYTASKYVGSDYTNFFDYEVVKDISCPISVAVQSDCGRTLYSIITKTVSCIDPEQRDSAVNANTQYNISNSVLYFVYNKPILIVGIIALITTAIVILVLWFRMREKKAEKLHREIDARQKDALREAYEAADRANHAKSDFLSSISHDIRTPLNAIIGMVAIASSHVEDETRVTYCLEKITTSSRHLLGLINEVLDMSKIESGKVSLIEEEFNLTKLLDEMLELVQPEIKAKNHELTVRIQNIQHGNVIGDSLRIQQVFVSILGNAVKYTPDGGRIEVEVSELPSNVQNVGTYKFVFKDNGIGMSEDYIQTIFDPFSRELGSTVNSIQGSGLGMAITKNIVQMMDGSINVESEQGKGSVFTVLIRLKLQDVKTEDVKEVPGKPLEQMNFEGRRLLLVEDNELNREIACEILGLTKIQIDIAENGEAAVKKFEKVPHYYYDMILMDVQMPIMNGYDASRAIRAMERPDAQKVPIIALTADAFAEDLEKAFAAQMNEHLSKPLDISKLAEVLDRWIN